jgi:hypothetical protein
MLRLALAAHRLDRLSSGEQTGRACRKLAAVIACQSVLAKRTTCGCNQPEKVRMQGEMFQPRGTKATAMSRLPHVKAVTGQIILYLENLNRATECV